MNLPNKLTILRMILVPFMILSFYMPSIIGGNEKIFAIITVAIFIIAAITDFLDGNIARKRNLVTNFGKFMDPLADKALVLVALILIVDGKIISTPYIASIALSIMLIRELVVSGLRLVGASNGVVIAADKLGKLKTITQDISLPCLLLLPVFENNSIGYEIFFYLGVTILIIASIISVISGISYVIKNKELFKN